MNIKDIAILVTICTIVSAGGIGGIVIAVIKFSANIIADRLSKQYENKLERTLEKYKTELSKKEYVSKTRFDAEFSIYKELSEKNISMVFAVNDGTKIVQGECYSDEEIESKLLQLQNIIDDAKLTNTRHAPFINEEIFREFCSLQERSQNVLILLKMWNMNRRGEHYVIVNGSEKYHEQLEVQYAVIDKQKELVENSEELLNKLRDYLSNLDVVGE